MPRPKEGKKEKVSGTLPINLYNPLADDARKKGYIYGDGKIWWAKYLGEIAILVLSGAVIVPPFDEDR